MEESDFSMQIFNAMQIWTEISRSQGLLVEEFEKQETVINHLISQQSINWYVKEI